MFQKVLIGLAALILLALLAIIVGPSFVDWNGYKGDIAAQIRDMTGRSLSIDGDISLSVLPSPTLSARNVRLANIEGGSAPDMLTLDAMEAHVALMPLLQRRVQIERITLVQPTILLEQLPDGRRNWSFDRPTGATPGTHGDEGSPEIQLDNLTIEQGTVHYRGPSGEQQIIGLDARISAQSLRGPFRAEGSAQLRAMPFSFELTMGRLSEGQRSPVGMTIQLPSADGKISFSGGVLLEADATTGSGKLTGSVASLGDLLAFMGAGEAEGQPTILRQPFELAAEVSGSSTTWQLDNLTLELGDMLAKGDAAADFTGGPSAQVKLALNRFDLDRLLEPWRETANDANGGGVAAPPVIALPEGLAAQVDLAVEALTYRGSIVSKARLLASLADGRLAVSRLSALLPGGSDATLAGRLTAESGQPRFDGTLEGGSDNLRAVLDWLDLSPPGIPRDRLRKASLTTQIAATPAAIELSDFNLRLDQSQLAGGIIVALPQPGVRSATAYGIGLVVDQINIDAYLPAPVAAAAHASAGAAPTPGLPVHLLAPLAGIDANIELRIASSTYRTHPIDGIHLDGTLHSGNLTLRDMSARGLAGGGGKLSGTVADLSGETRFDLAFEIDGADAGRAAQIVGASKQPPPGLGELTLRGTVTGGADDLGYDLNFAIAGIGADGRVSGKASGFTQGFPRIDTNLRLSSRAAGPLLALAGLETAGTGGLGALSIAGTAATGAEDISYDLSVTLAGAEAEGKVKGTLAGLPGSPHIDVLLDLHAGKPRPLLEFAGFDPAVADRIGEAGLAGSIRGPADDLRIDLRLDALSGQATANGSLAVMTPPYRFDLTLAVDHPELRELLAAFGLRAGRRGAIGPFAFAATVSGSLDAASIDELAIVAGNGRLTGDLRADMTGTRPVLTAALAGHDLDLSLLLGADRSSAGGGESGAAGTPARRSREAIDFSPLRAVDAEIDLAADAATLGDIRFEQLRTRLVLREGALTVEQFTGQAFGGSLDLTGRLTTRGVPAADAKLRATQVAIEELIRSGGVAGRVKGPVTVSADLRTSGSSVAAFIEGLAGSGTVDGTLTPLSSVRQQTGSAVLDVLGAEVRQVRGLSDVVAGALAAFAGRASALSGTFQIREGVVTTRDTVLENPQARALSRGSANVPAWTLDTTTDVFRAQDANAPYMTVRLTGVLDAPNIRLSGSAFSGRRGDSSSSGQSPDLAQPQAAPGSAEIDPAPVAQPISGPEGLGGLFDMLEQSPR